jgi:hypothetical protein
MLELICGLLKGVSVACKLYKTTIEMVINGGDQITHKEIIAYGNRVYRSPAGSTSVGSLADFRSQYNRTESIDDVLLHIKLTIKTIVCKTSILCGLYKRGEPISRAGKKGTSKEFDV